MKNLLFIIIFLFTTIAYSQFYVGLNGGWNEDTLGSGVNIRYDADIDLGLKANYFYSTFRDKDIFSTQLNYIFNKDSFYSPMISAGVEWNQNINPLLSLNNLIRIQDNLNFTIGYETNLQSSNYYFIGFIVDFNLNAQNKPRFF